MKESSDDPTADMARSGLREYAPDPATDDGGVKNLANAGNEPVEVSTDAIHVEHINPDAGIRLSISIEFVEQFQIRQRPDRHTDDEFIPCAVERIRLSEPGQMGT